MQQNQENKFHEDDPNNPKNKYNANYWLKVNKYYSFDKIWKKATGVIS